MQPNEFFSDDSDKKLFSAQTGPNDIEFNEGLSSVANLDLPLSVSEDTNQQMPVIEKSLNMLEPSFETRARLYLKPQFMEVSKMVTLLIIDTILSITYISLQIVQIFEGHYVNMQDKLVQILVAFGITTIVLIYSFADASRFLNRWRDKILYLISCLL